MSLYISKNICLVIFLCVFLTTGTYAHGPIHESIARVSKAIEANPENPALYLERGQYYQTDHDFDNAFADFERARSLDPEIMLLDFHCAKLFSENAFPNTALLYANRFLDAQPAHVSGLMVRASIYTQLANDSLAVLDFEQAIAHTSEPRPEYFTSIAKATLLADSTDFKAALSWLEKGEEALGFNIVLRSYAVDIALAQEEYDSAITTIEGILEKFNRKEKWLYRKAEILELADRPQLAKKVYQEAESAISQLPARHRRTRMVMELEANITMALARLASQ